MSQVPQSAPGSLPMMTNVIAALEDRKVDRKGQPYYTTARLPAPFHGRDWHQRKQWGTVSRGTARLTARVNPTILQYCSQRCFMVVLGMCIAHRWVDFWTAARLTALRGG